MAAHEHLQSTQFKGWLPVKAIKPTESSIEERYGANSTLRRTNEAGMQYAADMKAHIAEHGFTMGPLEVDYVKRSPRSKPATQLQQGHHRYWAAQQLGMTHVPVEGRSFHGPVPGLLEERP